MGTAELSDGGVEAPGPANTPGGSPAAAAAAAARATVGEGAAAGAVLFTPGGTHYGMGNLPSGFTPQVRGCFDGITRMTDHHAMTYAKVLHVSSDIG
jgi:hypothetical protein